MAARELCGFSREQWLCLPAGLSPALQEYFGAHPISPKLCNHLLASTMNIRVQLIEYCFWSLVTTLQQYVGAALLDHDATLLP
jgi:hypothetical protein